MNVSQNRAARSDDFAVVDEARPSPTHGTRKEAMPQSKQERNQFFGSTAWGLPPNINVPLAILTNWNCTLLESMATAQKEWADFIHHRAREDAAVARQLIACRSLSDMHEVYSRYLKTAFDQYQQQSERVASLGQSMAQHLAEPVGSNGKATARTRH